MKQIAKKLTLAILLNFQILMPLLGQENGFTRANQEFIEQYLKTNKPDSQNFAQPTMFTSVIGIGVAAAVVYTWHTHLIREDYKVAAKYPYAQAWYDAMTIKYPATNLANKLFLQKLYMVPKAFMPWCSTIQNIIFPQDALIRINSLYGMQLNNQILSDEDQLFLAEQEFILLHEAGHIEHNDILNKLFIFAGLEVASGIIDNKVISASSKNLINIFALHFFLSRYNERNADKFAYTHGDDNALKGGIAFFESEKNDPLFNIENEKYSSFIKTDSLAGNVVQLVNSCATVPTFYISKGLGTLINSTYATRWMYDYCRGMTHPGAPVRAEAIRKEQSRRSQK